MTKILIRIDQGQARQWHGLLRDALQAAGHQPGFAVSSRSGTGALPGTLAGRLETLIYGQRRARPCAALALSDADLTAAGPPDLILDLSSGGGPAPGPATLLVHTDGQAGEAGAIAAIAAGRRPYVTVSEAGGGGVLAAGFPAIETPDRLLDALDQLLRRSVTLLVKAVDAAVVSRHPGTIAARTASAPSLRRASPLGFAASQIARKMAGRIAGKPFRMDHWRIGYRETAEHDDGPAAGLAWPSAEYHWLAVEGRGYFADPFLFQHNGETHLFCEEFPDAAGKGIISATVLRPGEIPAPPKPVLERPYHLSYPFVFEHGGAIWMIPETSANRAVELYRAAEFPRRWVFEKTLLSGICAADATLFEHDGLLWIMAATADHGGSSWDCLSLFHASALTGPWHAHPLNPVLIDASAARPGGHVIRQAGGLLRVAQDCSAGYGAALSLCRIDRLDPENFAQTTLARLAPLAAWNAHGVHTLNRAGGFEVIDVCAPLW